MVQQQVVAENVALRFRMRLQPVQKYCTAPPLAVYRFRPKENMKRQNVLKTQNHFSSWRKMHSGNWKNIDAIWSGQPLCTQMSLVTNLLKLACVYQMLRSTMLVTEEQSM
ncbi:hypothetical protein Y068_20995 [Salmonella enterica subsp. enterica serovar Infantis str. CVM N15228]|nr:hypothetical protein CFSAN001691_22515 [Salmonella enterica subsp. enterica serovar Cerro str. CFSAN001691]ETB75020.1 hypothetical protein CFSAN001680_22380 [Salmonella enterica subsp. enterica serovar Cerro str. CFSAN001680]ETB82974.1 hypothetical protein CFSAN001690_22505 [Salmonella enterica subsp. enterica serovar Cerro str. CFSAN001690]ETB89278.1 hypothetical protein CFSAN001674_22185 [Salmonella enterica subsp. enterica serovar Cerro str. CFSAN001674]ETB97453.1 hypothetical protein CFS